MMSSLTKGRAGSPEDRRQQLLVTSAKGTSTKDTNSEDAVRGNEAMATAPLFKS